jgi:hypothetical protein
MTALTSFLALSIARDEDITTDADNIFAEFNNCLHPYRPQPRDSCDSCFNALFSIMKLLSFWCPLNSEQARGDGDTQLMENILLASRLLQQLIASDLLGGVFNRHLNMHVVLPTLKEYIYSIRLPALKRSLVSLFNAVNGFDSSSLSRSSSSSTSHSDCTILQLSNSSQELNDLWLELQDEVLTLGCLFIWAVTMLSYCGVGCPLLVL